MTAINLVHDADDQWLSFRHRAELRLILLDKLAKIVSYIAWVKDQVALERYVTVIVAATTQVGPSQIRLNWNRLPEDFWLKDWDEASTMLCAGDTIDTAETDWARQVLIDRLLLVQLVWAQWLAEGARTDIDWVIFLTRLARLVRREDPSIIRHFFSLGPLLRRFVAICEVAGHDQQATLNGFANEIDKARDSDKEGGFYYSDAVYWAEQLVPGIIIHALLAFTPENMQRAEYEFIDAKNSGTIDVAQARQLLWNLHRASRNFPDGIMEKLDGGPELPDLALRLAALQVSTRACAELFGEDPSPLPPSHE